MDNEHSKAIKDYVQKKETRTCFVVSDNPLGQCIQGRHANNQESLLFWRIHSGQRFPYAALVQAPPPMPNHHQSAKDPIEETEKKSKAISRLYRYSYGS